MTKKLKMPSIEKMKRDLHEEARVARGELREISERELRRLYREWKSGTGQFEP